VIVEVIEEGQSALADYARIPIAFEVREVIDATGAAQSTDRFTLTARSIDEPYVKDYDSLDGGPLAWVARFDLSHWTFFAALVDGARVGGAAVVFGARDVETLAGRADVAVLWDIRVAPSHRGRGVGAALIGAVEAWATTRGANWLEAETQNINAPACRFYERHGFVLRAVNPRAYPYLPNETQLLWYKKLVP
jgi:GNAT superfamily N-acetyltransferase